MGGVWSAGWVEIAVSFQPAERTPPTQSDKYHCRIDTASNFLLMMGAWMPETCREEKQINILNRIVHLAGFIYEIYLLPKQL